MKILAGLLAFISGLFVGNTSLKQQSPLPLNAAVIAYKETYFAPVVAEPGNFPRAKKSKQESEIIFKPSPALPVPMPTPPPKPILVPPVATTVTSTMPPQDLYLANPEPITPWLSMNLTLKGNSNDPDNPRVLPEITFDREYWRVEVFAYWAPNVIPPKPDVQNNYFKLEVYEKGTDKLTYTMTSGSNESLHGFQAFRKPGAYYFKVYTKSPSKWEMSFVVSPKIAQ